MSCRTYLFRRIDQCEFYFRDITFTQLFFHDSLKCSSSCADMNLKTDGYIGFLLCKLKALRLVTCSHRFLVRIIVFHVQLLFGIKVHNLSCNT